jgi:hypothetical protein
MIHRRAILVSAVVCVVLGGGFFQPARPVGSNPAEMRVQIKSPLPGARLSDPVVQVQFEATGGPFVDVVLYADSNFVDRLAPDKNARFSGTLVWKGAPLGVHRLKVMAMDANKNVAEAEADIEVVAGAAVRPPAGSAPSGRLQIRFLNVADGGTITARTGAQGLPLASLRVEADAVPPRDTFPIQVYVDADGLDIGVAVNTNKELSFRADFQWSPLRGNGKYVLIAKALSFDRLTEVSQRITIEVAGIPPSVPSPLAKIIQVYQKEFGLALAAPAVARFNDLANPSKSKWVSTAYIGPTLYEVDVWDAGRTWGGTRPVNNPQPWPACRPAGRLRLLVVFVDYRNTDLTPDAALKALKAAAARANGEYAQYATDHGWKTPILQLDVTGAYVSPPPSPGKLITAAQTKSLTGFDPAQFDLLLQVDLDSALTYQQPGNTKQAGGIAFGGCDGSGAHEVNIWIELKGGPKPDADLYYTLLSHELAHVLGWQHTWPLGSGSGGATCDWNNENPTWPTLLFGWTDTDGDGVPEILDPTPYGLKK